MQTVVNNLPLKTGTTAPAFWDEADIINQEIIRGRNRNRIDQMATLALAFLAGALITVTIQLFYR
jgi:hypothetical protein